MKLRWILAAAGSLALALLTLPLAFDHSVLVSSEAGAEATVTEASADSDTSFCEPEPDEANLDFTIKDMNGESVEFADYKGSVILLDFWATWCGPCKIEIPGFVELQDRYRDEGLVVLGFSVDDTTEKLKPFADEYKMNYPVLVGLGREDVQEAFGPIYGIPTTVLITREGQICKKHVGMSSQEEFEKEIKALL